MQTEYDTQLGAGSNGGSRAAAAVVCAAAFVCAAASGVGTGRDEAGGCGRLFASRFMSASSASARSCSPRRAHAESAWFAIVIVGASHARSAATTSAATQRRESSSHHTTTV